MNLIDIASWQHGIDLPAVFSGNPSLGGVIVKATQGTSYVNPDYPAWAAWLADNGKPLGLYHYLDLYGADAEARHFAQAAEPYIGRATLAIDYEGNTVRKGAKYLKACLDEVYRLTGVKAFVYCSLSIVQTNGLADIAAAGYPLWVAQYADNNPVHGFVSDPWQRGSCSPFDKITMQQYTSHGRLTGWGNNLDFDLFHGDEDAWDKLAPAMGGSVLEPLKPADPAVVAEVLMGYYGIGAKRVAELTNAGYDAESVQRKINELYAIAQKCRPIVGNDMDYILSIVKIMRQMEV